MPDTLKLNIGAGLSELPDFVPLDIKNGCNARKLDYADGTADEVYASHVLEHFGHGEVGAVLREWVRVLKPGGRLRISVPDLEWICREYMRGNSQYPLALYLMGGQTDEHDFHKVAFDEVSLAQLLRRSGLEQVSRWTPEYDDTSQLPVSLNLQAYKRNGDYKASAKIACVMSVPRLSFAANQQAIKKMLAQFRMPIDEVEGVFWGQCLERGIDAARQRQPDYILTIDYDTIFTPDDVQELINLAIEAPEADAIAPIQVKRQESRVLLSADGTNEDKSRIELRALDPPLTKVNSAHFGLTLFKSAALGRVPKPWFWGQPAPDGSWGDGRMDDDIYFWKKWKEAGNTVCTANHVIVGHLELVISWPTQDMRVVHQYVPDFWKRGRPREARL